MDEKHEIDEERYMKIHLGAENKLKSCSKAGSYQPLSTFMVPTSQNAQESEDIGSRFVTEDLDDLDRTFDDVLTQYPAPEIQAAKNNNVAAKSCCITNLDNFEKDAARKTNLHTPPPILDIEVWRTTSDNPVTQSSSQDSPIINFLSSADVFNDNALPDTMEEDEQHKNIPKEKDIHASGNAAVMERHPQDRPASTNFMGFFTLSVDVSGYNAFPETIKEKQYKNAFKEKDVGQSLAMPQCNAEVDENSVHAGTLCTDTPIAEVEEVIQDIQRCAGSAANSNSVMEPYSQDNFPPTVFSGSSSSSADVSGYNALLEKSLKVKLGSARKKSVRKRRLGYATLKKKGKFKDKERIILQKWVKKLVRREILKLAKSYSTPLASVLQDGKLNVESSSPRATENKMAMGKTEDTAIWCEGKNLMNVKAPQNKPSKCATKLLDMLFNEEELQDRTLFKLPRSTKQPLDTAKVEKMFEVLNEKYGRDQVEESYTAIVNSCNQKCRDTHRKMRNRTT